MSKLEIEAIKSLPSEYVCDGTNVVLWEPNGVDPMVIAINSKLPAITFRSGEWKNVVWAEIK